jgi:hypothetical protein
MMQETVPLPDPAVQPLVHPDDVPQARDLWRRAWLFSLAGSGCVLFLLGAVMWAATGAWLSPALAVVGTGAIAWLSHRRLARTAWDHIPRRRQDRERPESPRRRAVAHLVDVLALAAGSLALVVWTARAEQERGVAVFIVGAGMALVVLVAVSTVRLVRDPRARASARVPAALVLAVAVASVVGAVVWVGASESPQTVALVCGVCTPFVVAGPWWVRSRRSLP